ncbi:MAG: DUF6452 family protein [Flavobacterium sp.]|jgi:hypothetical protein|uniref:DUF6452 family protein n=1 Tax=Flavobacterium sp. TaxID=239 RepID=UPI0022C9782D|nr:DUF6452 family protein [Flavobacterium sp.]MCZ8167657.1 DUF6452 family protein [Flavobacterium sp.]MCZ8295732.1 DUF6452 family protein [Flavobacterium sp.]
MMRYSVLLLLPLFMVFSGCEKDDICSDTTPTTPRLVIEFYDITDTQTLKNISNLRITAVGMSDDITFNNVNKIQVPLNPGATTSTYEFIQNGADNDTTNNNTDKITFYYTHSTIYVSRACGHKMNFQLNTPDGVVLEDHTPTDGLWISNPTIVQSNITNENEVHLKLYF